MKIIRPTHITEEQETLDDAYNAVSISALPERYQELRKAHTWDQLQAVESYVGRYSSKRDAQQGDK